MRRARSEAFFHQLLYLEDSTAAALSPCDPLNTYASGVAEVALPASNGISRAARATPTTAMARATSATPLAYVFNGSQGLRAAAVLSQPTYLSGKSIGLVNSVESTSWKVLPYWQNGELVVNNTGYPSVAITVTNSQSKATPAPFDQFLNITMSQIASALGSTTASQLWQQAMSYHFLNLLFKLVPAKLS